MEFNIYNVESTGWKAAFDLIPNELKDLNFTPEWYQTWINHEAAEPICIHFEEDGFHFLYPFFRRRIKNYNLSKEYFDIQSAYGYGGVIVSHSIIPPALGHVFNKLTSSWLHDNNIVAEFIREHPLLTSFRRKAEYNTVRKNVYIETSASYKIPDKCARQNIAKALSHNATILYDEECNYLPEFIKLYQMTARRLGMHPYYNFSDDYFYKVKNLLGNHCCLIHIIKDDVIIASAMYLIYNDRANLHLTASRVEYQIIRSNDLLYYAAIEYSKKRGVKTLNVGGGLTADANDSLFRFKLKYASYQKDVMVGKNILNPAVYENLTKAWESRYPGLVKKYDNYLLKYHQQL
ncbi:MAG TPA: GNAT family N-acetyltransferase [Lentimicrobium sp.]|nr:GNAT family N-acetyltransferase [Lentimicrobium sp.]